MIYLASTSPRRQAVLIDLAIPFQVVESKFLESQDHTDPYGRVEYNACGKATNAAIAQGTILGIDTIGYLHDSILEKPKDEADAYQMLRRLSASTHLVLSGVCFWQPETKQLEYFGVETKVTFYELSDKEINDYIATGEPMDKAASYGIQGKGRLFVKSIEGDYWNVVGMPMEVVRKVLGK